MRRAPLSNDVYFFGSDPRYQDLQHNPGRGGRIVDRRIRIEENADVT